MKFKVIKGTALFDSLTALFKRISESKDACKELAKEFGAENYAASDYVLAGKIKAFYFRTSEKPFDNWMAMERGYTHWFMPKQPKSKKDPLNEIWGKIKAIPVVELKELEELLQYHQGAFSTEKGLGWFTRPAVVPGDEYFLLDFGDSSDFNTPTPDMVEILDSEYKKLMADYKLNDKAA